MMKAPVQGRAAPQNQKLVICGFLCTIFCQFWHVPDWRSHTGTGDAQAQRWRTGAQRVPSCTASKPVKCRIVSCSVMHRRCKATVTEKDQQQTAVELVCTVIFVARSPCGSTLEAPVLCCSFWTRVLRRWPGTDANEACAEFAISFYQKRKEECLHLQSPNLVQAPPDRRFREAPPA